MAKQKCLSNYLPTYSNVHQNIYLLFLKESYHKHTDTNEKAKKSNEEKRYTKETKDKKEKENAVAVNCI